MQQSDGLVLIMLARHAIEDCLNIENKTAFPHNSIKYGQKRGVFITLKAQHLLRGCIGCIVSDDPLYKSVPYFAVQAAFHDRRFKPITETEWTDIRIHLSILSQPKAIDSIEQIKLGQHGIIFEYDAYRSVFLPEVAIEHHWDVDTLLVQLEQKALAPKDSWKKAKFKIFETELFCE